MQKIGLQIEFGAVAAPLSGHYPCPCGARVPPPIPSGLARHGNHSIDENELADRYPFAYDSGSECSKRLSDESDVSPLSDFPDHDLRFRSPQAIRQRSPRAEPAPAVPRLDASTKPFRRRRESRCKGGFPGQSSSSENASGCIVVVAPTFQWE